MNQRLIALSAAVGALLLAQAASAAVDPAAASAGDFLIGVWTTEKGLPNSSVTTIAQTPDGYLWVGTYNGLARFDGARFLTFDPFNAPGLQHARIRKLFLDEAGTLWINTYDGSLTTRRGDGFRLEWRGGGSVDSAATLLSSRSNSVLFLLNTGDVIRRARDGGTNEWQTLRPSAAGSAALALEDGAGTVWYRGRDQRMYRLQGDEFVVVPANSAPAGARLNWLANGPGGALWVGGDKGLWAWNGTRFTDRTPTNAEPPAEITFFHFSRDGSLWCVADGRVRRAAGRRWVAEVEPWQGALAGLSTRLGAVEDAAGGTWFYHYGRGLFHVAASGVARHPSVAEGLPGDRVDCLLRDREGNLWAGIDRGGLALLRERRFRVVTVPDGATTRAIVSVCEDAAGNILLGTFGGGLHQLTAEGLEAVPLPAKAENFVFSLCPDGAQRLWISAGEEDLFASESGVIQPSVPAVHAVKSLLADRQGQIWIGTKSSLYRLAQGALRRMTSELASDPAVRALAEDASGGVWAGTGRGELLRIRGEQVETFKANDALAGSPVWALRTTPDGEVWAGTFRGGLLRWKDGEFARFTERDGLPSDVICQVLDDSEGFLWLGTPQGIARVAIAELDTLAEGRGGTLSPAIYGLYDGLPTLECSSGYQPAAWRARDGRLWFATAKGAVSIQPAALSVSAPPPPVIIEEVLVDGTRAVLSPAVGATGKLPEVVARPGQRQVEFRYTGLSLSAPDKVRFRRQLEGLDPGWVKAGDQRAALYNYLRPGRYVFRVAAANSDGAWNEAVAAVVVRVQPHFYETWWFPTLLGAAVIGALVIVVRRAATQRLRRQLQQLERQRAVERDRARIAKDIHDDLGAGLTQITLLSELARHDAPEAEAHLSQICGTARELTRAMDEIVWAVNPQNDTLESLITYATKFAQDFLGVARVRCRLELPARLPAVPLAAEVRHNLFLALREAFNNVVKHARATEVWLRLRLDEGSFTLVIEDNGKGLGAAPSAAAQDGRSATGHGLGNLQARLDAIGGSVRWESLPGQGTRVEFTIQLPTSPSPTPVADSTASVNKP